MNTVHVQVAVLVGTLRKLPRRRQGAGSRGPAPFRGREKVPGLEREAHVS